MPSLQDKLLSQLENLKDPRTGHEVCEFFYELPSKADYPDYYQVIKNPIALETIRAKTYNDEEELKQDLYQMCDNAKLYNRQGSRVYKDAQEIETFVNGGQRRKSLVIKIKPSSSSSSVVNPLMKAYKAMAGLKEGSYLISGLFLELPSKVDYGYYYQVVKSPISLKEIKAKVEKGTYERVAKRKGFEDQAKAMEEDVVLMVRNAFTFNESTSDVCKDALALLKEFRKQTGLPTPANEDFTQVAATTDVGVGIISREKEQPTPAKVEKSQPNFKPQQLAKKAIKISAPKVVAVQPDYLKPCEVADEDVQLELDEVMFKRATFEVGDFVYLAQKDDDNVAIGVISRIFKNSQGRNRFIANWFLHPQQVLTAYQSRYGMANVPEEFNNIKFDVKELYLSGKTVEHGPMDINGRCSVMFAGDYIKGRYMGYNNEDKQKDVWFFENRLLDNGKSIQIVQQEQWTDCLPELVREMESPALIPFNTPRPLNRLGYIEVIKKISDVLPQVNRFFMGRGKAKSAEPESEEESPDEYDSGEEAEVESDEEYNEGRGGGRRSLPAPANQPQMIPISIPGMPMLPMPPGFAQMTPAQQQVYIQMFTNMVRMQQQQRAGIPQQGFQRQQMAMPDQDRLPVAFVEKFTNKNGKVLWFSAPPRVPVPSRSLHSEKYLAYLAEKQRNNDQMEVDEPVAKKLKATGNVVWVERKSYSFDQIESHQDFHLLVKVLEDASKDMQIDAQRIEASLKA